MKKSETLILDLGGVLLNIDYDAPVREFLKLGINNFRELFAQAEQTQLFDDFEKGNISNDDFRNEIRKISQLDLTDVQIDLAWNSILLDLPAERMQLLTELKKRYQLFLLSNTNNIHIPEFEKSLENVYGEKFFHSHFDEIYYSSRMGMRKPDREIFEFVLSKNDLIPEKTIFIDDSVQHIRGASACRIRALHLDLKKEKLMDLLSREKII